jgi:hypothetical protein
MHEGRNFGFCLVVRGSYLRDQRRELLPSHQRNRSSAKKMPERQELTQYFDQGGRKHGRAPRGNCGHLI